MATCQSHTDPARPSTPSPPAAAGPLGSGPGPTQHHARQQGADHQLGQAGVGAEVGAVERVLGQDAVATAPRRPAPPARRRRRPHAALRHRRCGPRCPAPGSSRRRSAGRTGRTAPPPPGSSSARAATARRTGAVGAVGDDEVPVDDLRQREGHVAAEVRICSVSNQAEAGHGHHQRQREPRRRAARRRNRRPQNRRRSHPPTIEACSRTQQRRDQEARQGEERRHPEEAARRPPEPGVVQEHGGHGDGPQPVEGGPVAEGRDGSRPRRRSSRTDRRTAGRPRRRHRSVVRPAGPAASDAAWDRSGVDRGRPSGGPSSRGTGPVACVRNRPVRPGSAPQRPHQVTRSSVSTMVRTTAIFDVPYHPVDEA